MTTQPQSPKARPEALAERVYQALKADIFAFRLMPGDRFSESEIAGRMAVSRTPVRQALFRLEREGFVEVWFRSGWQIKNFDFAWFESLYDPHRAGVRGGKTPLRPARAAVCRAVKRT